MLTPALGVIGWSVVCQTLHSTGVWKGWSSLSRVVLFLLLPEGSIFPLWGQKHDRDFEAGAPSPATPPPPSLASLVHSGCPGASVPLWVPFLASEILWAESVRV